MSPNLLTWLLLLLVTLLCPPVAFSVDVSGELVGGNPSSASFSSAYFSWSSSSFSARSWPPWPWGYKCPATPHAQAALKPICPNGNLKGVDNGGFVGTTTSIFTSLTVTDVNGIGYVFVNATGCDVDPREGQFEKMINATGGVIIIPEKGVDPVAYAPYAQAMAMGGLFAAILTKQGSSGVIDAMNLFPTPQMWALVGHGVFGGEAAARLTRALFPRVTTLVLHAAALPADIDFSKYNLEVILNYGKNDLIVTPEMVQKSFGRLPGDADVNLFRSKSHYNFAYTSCKNELENMAARTGAPGPHHHGSSDHHELGMDTQDELGPPSDDDLLLMQLAPPFWARTAQTNYKVATARALSYGDNRLLTPGNDESKVYPADGVVVQFQVLPLPDNPPGPVRSMFVLKPKVPKGGYVYYPGALVDSRAYLPLAFQIASRGYAVIIPQIPRRVAFSSMLVANTIISSDHAALQSIPRDKWAVGGHSLGGVTAFNYAAFPGRQLIRALVMHAGLFLQAPMSPPANLTLSSLPVASIYGTLDGTPGPNQTPEEFFQNSALNPLRVNVTATVFFSVRGANHAQIGDYGYQDRDRIATIGHEEQERIFGRLTADFLDKAMGYNSTM